MRYCYLVQLKYFFRYNINVTQNFLKISFKIDFIFYNGVVIRKFCFIDNVNNHLILETELEKCVKLFKMQIQRI